MTNRDEVAELADRIEARRRRGEDYEAEFAIEWASLTGEEWEDFLALMDARIAHRKEKLEGITEDIRALEALRVLLVSSDAPPGMMLPEAIGSGYIGIVELIEAIRGAIDPLVLDR